MRLAMTPSSNVDRQLLALSLLLLFASNVNADVYKWLDKDGNGAAHTIRITHAWLRTGSDWRIIGGMSMPEPSEAGLPSRSPARPCRASQLVRPALGRVAKRASRIARCKLS